jgi:hypothetical protein
MYWFMCKTVLSEMSLTVRPFHVSKDVVAILSLPITPGNLFIIFCHPRQKCAERFSFYLALFLSFPMNTIVSSANFSAVVIIRRILRLSPLVTFCLFTRISIAYRPVIKAIKITYIISQYHSKNMLDILSITSVQAIHNVRQKFKTALDGRW